MFNVPVLLSLILLSAPSVLRAAGSEEDPVLAKMRDTLRATMTQLRDAQAQIANLQAADIAAKQTIDKQTAEIKQLKAEAVAERNASANALSEANTKIAEREAAIAGHLAALEKWRKDYTDAIARARKGESERDKHAATILELQRLTEAQRIQNVQIYTVGMEILRRYDNFWFGDALLAREPFVGNTKVKLQGLAQDGHDKLLAARIQDVPIPGVKYPKKKKSPPAPAATDSPAPSPAPSPSPTPKPN